MKVLHLIETFAPLGGAELYMINQISLLEEAGIENVVVYWKEHSKTFRELDYPVYYIADTGLERLTHIETLVKEWDPSLIYLHTVRNPSVISTVSQMKPAVVYMHDFYSVCPGLAKFYKRGRDICTRPYGLGCVAMIYLRRCASARHPLSVYHIMQTTPKYLDAFKGARRVLVASSYMKNLLIQNGLKAEHISILPYFVRMPGNTNPFDTRTDAPKLLFVGRLEAEKGLGYLLRALAQVSRPYRLLVAGEGSREETYKALVKELGIAEQVDFLGWINPSAMKEIYEETTCLIFPSIWPEPFGMVGIEAFYNSRPVIAFDVGGVSDWLVDGENGFLVPSQDIGQLANRIETLLAEPELANKMGANGYRHVYEHYRDETHLAKLLTIFEGLAE